MQQRSFFPPTSKEHGGSIALKKRRGRRPLTTKCPLHVTLKSDLAKGPRALTQYRERIERIAKRAGEKFHVTIYEYAICATHLHFVIRGKTREGIQNFFRVFAGHIAQAILQDHPLSDHEERACDGCIKNHRKFWSMLIYSRVLSWGREFEAVRGYVRKNVLESLYLIAYSPRKKRKAPS